MSQQATRLVAGTPAIAAAHFVAEADPYDSMSNPDGYVNVGTAENRLVWDMLGPRLCAARAVTAADVRYAPLHGTVALRSQVARFLARGGAPIDPEDLVVVSGATAALDIIASVLCDPGEALAVPVPYYGALDTDLTGRSGARLVPVPPLAGAPLPDAAAVVDTVRRARSAGTTVRALVLTSPHNPLGLIYRETELRAFASACAALDLDLIADEVYAHCAFAGPAFVSARDAASGPLDPQRVHVVWGFAKDLGLPGLKVGVLHTRQPQVRVAARELAYFAPVSTDTQWLLTELLAADDWTVQFLTTSRNRLAASYAAAAGHLTAAGVPFRPAEAGFSIWTDLRGWLDAASPEAERLLWQRLFRSGRINLLPGAVFHHPEPGWFRLCHTTDPATVAEAVARLRHVLGDSTTAFPPR
ncbi:aminotransferase class I/II-fold pyridoxal phosphate-dependent enzyme [Actinoplanes sp. KI2]|uniref:aminotransferase class I/II-fold pyridoxal phosphate-dependent enzyme n=1 Tax=Actinoplanes sp. KI2 TaxID=2983315 RepID=UPI0021D605A2|nr:aminotransferase class I/II-fold pyridoxal phosphate-dependent enzyme [Actinoplanes sp. KI2]MCU7726630.1 aminotransferase class I/II-fold pyridoxal phosphate-dependent enzyme [Actinoplanes sp. KI2]